MPDGVERRVFFPSVGASKARHGEYHQGGEAPRGEVENLVPVDPRNANVAGKTKSRYALASRGQPAG